MDYVYGIRCKDKRNNLFHYKERLFYYAAAVAVQLDYESNTQQFFNKHSDDIIAMAFDPNNQIFATGELGPKPSVYLWDPQTM